MATGVHHNVTHYLTDLLVYADGMVDCWGWVTQEQFRGKVESGWVTTTVPPGEPVSADLSLRAAGCQLSGPGRCVGRCAFVTYVCATPTNGEGERRDGQQE